MPGMAIEARAHARAGLLGNPSDGYYGKTISISVGNFAAHVSLELIPFCSSSCRPYMEAPPI
jgi:glucuronokinase